MPPEAASIYQCPACGHILQASEDEFQQFTVRADIKQADQITGASNFLLYKECHCSKCYYTGISDIFIPDKQFEVCKKGRDYYLTLFLHIGLLTIKETHLESPEVGKVHYEVSQIRNCIDIALLPQWLTSSNKVVRNEAHRKYGQLQRLPRVKQIL